MLIVFVTHSCKLNEGLFIILFYEEKKLEGKKKLIGNIYYSGI